MKRERIVGIECFARVEKHLEIARLQIKVGLKVERVHEIVAETRRPAPDVRKIWRFARSEAGSSPRLAQIAKVVVEKDKHERAVHAQRPRNVEPIVDVDICGHVRQHKIRRIPCLRNGGHRHEQQPAHDAARIERIARDNLWIHGNQLSAALCLVKRVEGNCVGIAPGLLGKLPARKLVQLRVMSFGAVALNDKGDP